MGTLGNIIWMITGGWLSALGWVLAGFIWCITIVGIPIGKQCFKFASLSLCPFGKEIIGGGGAGSVLLNLLWMIISGIPMALGEATVGCILCVTIVGIPFGIQHFKLARLALAPFGATVQ